jgi:hypothetical protein
MAERWYGRLSTILDHRLSGRQPIILYATMPQFQQTNVVGGIGEGTGGVTEALMRRIVLPTGGTLTDMDHVIGHELVHAFQYDITGRGTPTSLGALPAAAALPLWFIEGMAEYLSIGPVSPFTAMWMRGSLVDSLPSYRDLENPRYFPYRYGQALLAYIGGVWGIGSWAICSGRARGRGTWDGRFRRCWCSRRMPWSRGGMTPPVRPTSRCWRSRNLPRASARASSPSAATTLVAGTTCRPP